MALAGERSEPVRLGVRDHPACSVQATSRARAVQATVSRRPLGNVTLTPLAVVANVTGITEASV
jgi:hypothetical protein